MKQVADLSAKTSNVPVAQSRFRVNIKVMDGAILQDFYNFFFNDFFFNDFLYLDYFLNNLFNFDFNFFLSVSNAWLKNNLLLKIRVLLLQILDRSFKLCNFAIGLSHSLRIWILGRGNHALVVILDWSTVLFEFKQNWRLVLTRAPGLII